MFGKVIDTFGTKNCAYMCECPVCKTNYTIKPNEKAETNVRITTETHGAETLLSDGVYTATVTVVDIVFHITCTQCGVAFKSISRTNSVCHTVGESDT